MNEWLYDLPYLDFLEMLARLAMALVGGAVIGWEREAREKPAGLRTHMLVGLGSATFMIAGLELAEGMSDVLPRIDPSRALEGVIGGVGFLGAGAIIQSRGSVQGITTAASIWIAASIGVCAGMGRFGLAITSGLMALIVLWLVGRIEHSVLAKEEPEA